MHKKTFQYCFNSHSTRRKRHKWPGKYSKMIICGCHEKFNVFFGSHFTYDTILCVSERESMRLLGRERKYDDIFRGKKGTFFAQQNTTLTQSQTLPNYWNQQTNKPRKLIAKDIPWRSPRKADKIEMGSFLVEERGRMKKNLSMHQQHKYATF